MYLTSYNILILAILKITIQGSGGGDVKFELFHIVLVNWQTVQMLPRTNPEKCPLACNDLPL